MGERKENSVLFSLRELKGIEENRVQEEEDARRDAEEQRVRAQLDAERRAREMEEARRRAIEDEDRQRREEEERRVREERLAYEAQQRLVQVETHAAAERERLRGEMEKRVIEASRKRPTLLIGIAVLLVAAVGGLGYFLHQKQQEADAKTHAYEQKVAEVKAAIAGQQEKVRALITEKETHYEAILAAQTPEDKEAAQGKLSAVEGRIKGEKEALRQLQATLSELAGGATLTPTPAPAEKDPATGEK